MKYAIVSLSYDVKLLLPSKDLSKFLEVVGAATRVTSEWDGVSKSVLVHSNREVTVELVDSNEVMTREQYVELRARAKAAELAAEAEA